MEDETIVSSSTFEAETAKITGLTDHARQRAGARGLHERRGNQYATAAEREAKVNVEDATKVASSTFEAETAKITGLTERAVRSDVETANRLNRAVGEDQAATIA